MENPCFVPITSAEHASSVVLALRSKNRSVAEVHLERSVDDDCHEARGSTLSLGIRNNYLQVAGRLRQ